MAAAAVAGLALNHAEADRLAHAWHLALSGLRRGELCGLRWSDVDLNDGTLTVAHNRVSVNGQAMDSDPKTHGSGRTLPLTPALTAALRHAQATQRAERFALGPDYGQGEHGVCDEAGRAYHPDTMSNYGCAVPGGEGAIDPAARRSPYVRDADAIFRACRSWCVGIGLGHADPAFTMRTYVHSQNDALKTAAMSLQRVVSPSCQ